MHTYKFNLNHLQLYKKNHFFSGHHYKSYCNDKAGMLDLDAMDEGFLGKPSMYEINKIKNVLNKMLETSVQCHGSSLENFPYSLDIKS